MKKTLTVPILFLALVGLLTACGGGPASPAPDSGGRATVPARQVSEWDALVAAAQKEGQVTLYGTAIAPATRDGVIKAFKEQYGIDVEFITGRGAEIVERLRREVGAGLNIPDVGMSGTTTITTQIKPLGVLEPLEPLMVLPEIKDPAKWRKGKIAYFDEERKVISLVEFVSPSITINTQMVKAGEITAYEDLLAPKWKGQIVLNDPTTGGGGGTWFGAMVRRVMGMEKGPVFMRELAKQQPVLSRDERQMIEWVARAKYPMAIGISQSEVTAFIDLGAPVAQPRLKEPFHTSPGWANIISFARAPHPNARKLFINWVLSRDGGAIVARTYGAASTRADVPLEGVDPALVPTPQDISLDEAFYKSQSDNQKLAREIFAAFLK